ncbi:MAG TPA: ribonuclease Z [Thermoplasmataceae archaeon]|nr:ribonuclease Z [Thermoplasmataceae archaeon]
MATIEFLGNWSSNIVAGKRNISIIIDRHLIMDFGPHSIESLLEMHIDPCRITTVFISHMHLDHFAGVPELLWYRAIHKCKETLIIVGPKGIGTVTKNLLRSYHTPEAFEIYAEYREEKFENAEGFLSNHLIRDIGFRVELDDKTIYYTGDTAYTENTARGAEGCDYLFHEVTYSDQDRKLADFWKHSTVSDAIRAFEESHSRVLVPVHLTDSSENTVKNIIERDQIIRFPAGTIR